MKTPQRLLHHQLSDSSFTSSLSLRRTPVKEFPIASGSPNVSGSTEKRDSQDCITGVYGSSLEGLSRRNTSLNTFLEVETPQRRTTITNLLSGGSPQKTQKRNYVIAEVLIIPTTLIISSFVLFPSVTSPELVQTSWVCN